RDTPVQPLVPGEEHLAHAAVSQPSRQAIGADPRRRGRQTLGRFRTRHTRFAGGSSLSGVSEGVIEDSWKEPIVAGRQAAARRRLLSPYASTSTGTGTPSSAITPSATVDGAKVTTTALLVGVLLTFAVLPNGTRTFASGK